MRRTVLHLWLAGLVVAATMFSWLPADAREQDPASRSYLETLPPGDTNPPPDPQASKDSHESAKAPDSEQGKRKQDLRSMLLLWFLRKHPLQ
jgi:hypothetical protein